MATLPFIDSFDHYAQAQASLKYDVGQPTLAPGEGTFGSTGMITSGSAALKLFDLPQSQFGFSMYLRSIAIYPGLNIFFATGIAFSVDCNFTWLADGRIRIVVGNLTLDTSLARTMHASTWHHVGGSLKISASPTPPIPPHTVDAIVIIDGVEVLNVSGVPMTGYAQVNPPNFTRAGHGPAISGAIQYKDDFVLTDLGIYDPSNVQRLVPTADESIQWAEPAFPAPHFSQIDETIASNADEIATGTDGNRDRFNGSSIVGTVIGDPFVIQSVFWGTGSDHIWHVFNLDEFEGVYNVFSTYPQTGKNTAYADSLLHGVRYTV